jgi:hypothetical protein
MDRFIVDMPLATVATKAAIFNGFRNNRSNRSSSRLCSIGPVSNVVLFTTA